MFQIGDCSTTVQFSLLTSGIFVLYQLSSYFQEFVFRIPEYKYAWFMSLCQFITAVIFSSGERLFTGDSGRRAPFVWYFVMGFLTFAPGGLTTMSLNHVNFPTMVVFKSAKVIPVMVAGLIVLGKRYSLLDYLSAVFLFVGLSLFVLADAKTRPSFDVTGVAALCLALIGDAFAGNIQEKVIKRFHIPLPELVQYSFAVALAMNLVLCTFTGELFAALDLCARQPRLYGMLFSFCAASYCGLHLVLNLVKRFGALTVAIVVSVRKLVTIALSFVLFPKPLTSLHGYAIAMLVLSSLATVLSKRAGHARATTTSANAKQSTPLSRQSSHSPTLSSNTMVGQAGPTAIPRSRSSTAFKRDVALAVIELNPAHGEHHNA